MRTSKSTVCLLILFLYLACLVQQCHVLMIASVLTNSLSSALTMTSAVGMTIAQSMFQSIVSTIGHGLSTLHTMYMSLVSGFIMGNLFLMGFILVLFALVPAEEYRGLGGSSVFAQIRQPHLLPYIPPHFENATGLDFINNNSSILARNKRSLPSLVSQRNATSLSFTLPSSALRSSSPSPYSSSSSKNVSQRNHQFQYNIRFALDENDNITNPLSLNGSDTRIPRFFGRFVPRDPLNCLPLLLCGLSAARKPSERTEVLNDYAYLLKEFMEPEDRSNEDSSQEDDIGIGNKNRYRHGQVKWMNELVNAIGKKKDKDEVDKIIEQMRKEEDEKVEDLVLTEMADDPTDLKYALEDLKLRGLSKTVSKMPKDSKKKYIKNLMRDESGEEVEGEVIDDPNYDTDDYTPMSMMGNYPRNDYPDSSSREYYYDTRNLVRGGFPPAPPTPPVPEYGGVDDDVLYKKNLKILDDTLNHGPPPFQRRWIPMGPPSSFPSRRRSKRDVNRRNGPPPRGFLQKKRGEAAMADNVFDKARVGAEVGAITRNNRQCRALFNECPIKSLVRPEGDDSGAPFLNRAVNNLRRVLLGTPPEVTKQRRVTEIKEVIQQLHPPAHHGGSEVRVVLNIGPSPPPIDPHRAGGSPPPPLYTISHGGNPSALPAPLSTRPVPMGEHYSHEYTSYKNPSPVTTKRSTVMAPSTSKPGSLTTQRPMNYHKPSLPSPYPSKGLNDLEKLLKTTLPSINSAEDSTTDMPQEETTLNVFTDVDSGESVEMEDEPVFPTQYPISKDEYADNLRETFNIFQRFKEANKNPQSNGLTTARPRSSTTKKPAGSGSKTDPKKKIPGVKPEEGDQPQKDLDHEENDVQGILSIIKKFREKYLPKIKGKGKKKKKKKKKKKPSDSSEESSEEDPYDGYIPTLVAVPPPEVRKQINWRSGTTLIKDGVYHLLFGKRQVKPLPNHPIHPHPNHKPIRHDVHYHEHHPPPPPHHHHHPHRFRATDSESGEENDIAPTLLPTSSTPASSSKSSSTSRPKSSTSKPKRPSKSKPKTNKPTVITQRPIKIKLKTPRPLIIADSLEEDYRDMPPRLPPPPPPPHPPPQYLQYMENSSGSYEDEYDADNSAGPTRPKLLYTPFTHVSSRPQFSSKSTKTKKTKKGATKSSPTSTPTSGRNFQHRISKYTVSKTRNPSSTSSKTTSRTTTTAKPKRKMFKYKHG